MSSVAPEYEPRESCVGCTWHDTLPETWYVVTLVGHYCYRESGAPSLRGVSDGTDPPLGCSHRYEPKTEGKR